MADTPNLGITQLTEGQSQKEITINTALVSFDNAIAGKLVKDIAGAVDVTLTSPEWIYAMYEFTGNTTANINIIVPVVNRRFSVLNATTGPPRTIAIKTATGTGVVLLEGEHMVVEQNGDVMIALTSGTGGGGADTLLELTDTPDTYTGQASKVLAVKTDETGTEFVTPAAGGSGTLLGLTDVPDTYTGQAGKVLAVKSDQTGTEFITPAAGGGASYWNRSVLISASLTTGLLAFWKLEEASGNRVDSVASLALVPQGTVANLTNAAGKTGQALRLNPSSGSTFLGIADNATLSVGANVSFTVSCWVYWDGTPAAGAAFVGKGNATASYNNVEYMLWFSSVLRFGIGSGSNWSDLQYPAVTPVASTWYFLVGWYDHVADIQYFQVNNGTIAQVANSAGSHDSASGLDLGRQPNYAASPGFNGRIDNVMFYKRLLSADERTAWYNAGAGQDYPPTGLPVGVVTPTTAGDMVALTAQPDTPTGTTDGTIRWTGTDFEGRKGGVWVSLTT